MMSKARAIALLALLIPGGASAAEWKAERRADPMTDQQVLTANVTSELGQTAYFGCAQNQQNAWSLIAGFIFRQKICPPEGRRDVRYRFNGDAPIAATLPCNGPIVYFPGDDLWMSIQSMSRFAIEITEDGQRRVDEVAVTAVPARPILSLGVECLQHAIDRAGAEGQK